MVNKLQVYISGGPSRERFSNGLTQEQNINNLKKEFPGQLEFSKSGKKDVIIIDDQNTEGASDTALATLNCDGKVMKLSKFRAMMKRRNAKKFSGNAETMTEDLEAKMQKTAISDNKSDSSQTEMTVAFISYVSLLYMFAGERLTAEEFMKATEPVALDLTHVLVGTNNAEKMNQAWLAYFKQIVQSQAMLLEQQAECAKAIIASSMVHRSLGFKSNAILTAYCKAHPNESEHCEAMLNFFTDHDETIVELIVSRTPVTALNALLKSAAEFAALIHK